MIKLHTNKVLSLQKMNGSDICYDCEIPQTLIQVYKWKTHVRAFPKWFGVNALSIETNGEHTK